MKQTTSLLSQVVLTLLILSMFVLDSCSVVGGVFKAGAWTGIILVVVVIAVIIFIISKMGGGKSS